MDSVSDLMKTYGRTEPPELSALKEYVLKNYGAEAKAEISNKAFVLSVKSASLAGNLHADAAKIKKACGLDLPLKIRISY